jgi:hypothetical protein
MCIFFYISLVTSTYGVSVFLFKAHLPHIRLMNEHNQITEAGVFHRVNCTPMFPNFHASFTYITESLSRLCFVTLFITASDAELTKKTANSTRVKDSITKTYPKLDLR